MTTNISGYIPYMVFTEKNKSKIKSIFIYMQILHIIMNEYLSIFGDKNVSVILLVDYPNSVTYFLLVQKLSIWGTSCNDQSSYQPQELLTNVFSLILYVLVLCWPVKFVCTISLINAHF